ncbi:MAG: hypothetical protein V1830_01970 [Candidatus Omnitrophota bacterium]
MKIAVFLFFALLLFSPCLAKNIPEALKESKPANLSIVDKVLLRQEILRVGASRAVLLVSRITGKVEYVWSNVYKCYVRPKYTMMNAQLLYDQFHD